VVPCPGAASKFRDCPPWFKHSAARQQRLLLRVSYSLGKACGKCKEQNRINPIGRSRGILSLRFSTSSLLQTGIRPGQQMDVFDELIARREQLSRMGDHGFPLIDALYWNRPSPKLGGYLVSRLHPQQRSREGSIIDLRFPSEPRLKLTALIAK